MSKSLTNPQDWLQQYGDYLFRYGYSRLRDMDAAEEVLQETLVAGLKNRDQFSGKASERAWLLGILKRKIVDHIRKRNRQRSVTGPAEDSFDPSEAMFDHKGKWKLEPRFSKQPSELLETKEFWQAFRDCLSGLPDRQRDAFAFREIDGKKSAQICKDLDITPSNFWVLLHRARLGLALCLKKGRWQ